MNEILQLELNAKKYNVLNKVLQIQQNLNSDALRYKHKADDLFYKGAYDVTHKFINRLEALTTELEIIFKSEVK